MRICIFASGSGGNCLLLSDGSTHVLVDAGISMRRIEASLREADIAMSDITGVLITHEHSDHISGLKMLLKYHHLPVYAPHTVANHMRGMLPDIDGSLNIIEVGTVFELGSLRVRAFHTPHDTDESVGYRFSGTGSFAIATDMGHVTDEVLDGLTGAETVLIESNHDIDMLSYGPYPVYLKRRILSDRGHLSNEACAQLACALAKTGVRSLVLGHLSRENNRPGLAERAVREALDGEGFSAVTLRVAPAEGDLELEVTPCCASN